jgi:hypothetical protein
VFSDDRLSARVEVRGMPLGEVLRRLLNNAPADIQWKDPTLQEQPITGSFNGPIADVVRKLLHGTNFIIAHSDADGAVARVIVLGRSDQTAAFAPGMVLVPPPATPPPPQTARPVAPAQIPKPPPRPRPRSNVSGLRFAAQMLLATFRPLRRPTGLVVIGVIADIGQQGGKRRS